MMSNPRLSPSHRCQRAGLFTPHPNPSGSMRRVNKRLVCFGEIPKFTFSLTLLLMTLFAGCTAHYPVNPPLLDAGAVQNNIAILEKWQQSDRSDKIGVLLAFSGGGTRAAAFSYGVLEVLADTEIVVDNRERRILDEIDTISSVSGGSFTAAYYGLFGDRIFEDFKNKFLYRDVQTVLLKKIFLPWHWFDLGSGLFGRSELSANYYDEILFKGGTFGDMAASGGPLVRINATDAGLGVQFPFNPGLFSTLCSDLSKFSVARAVTASSAVPVLFSSVTIRNYADTCGYSPPDWMQDALEAKDRKSRRYRLAAQYAKYFDREHKPYIHLYDGGLSDNLGVRSYLNILSVMGSAYEAIKYRGFADTRRILIMVVNSQTELEPKFDHNEGGLGLFETIEMSSSIPLNEYTFESMTLLRQVGREIEMEIAENRCAEYEALGKPTEGCDDIRVSIVDVSFDELPEEKDRRYLKHLPTSFQLTPEAVDKLRWAAREILTNSAEFQDFLNSLK